MSIGKKFLSLLNRLIPKKNLIMFNSFPPLSDNAYELYRYLVTERKDLADTYDIIWALDSQFQTKPMHELLREQDRFVEKKSAAGMAAFLRARYVISTHVYFGDIFPGAGQKNINLWHGCGYKKVPLSEARYRGDYSIATSPLYCEIQSRELDIPAEHIYDTGLPKNDILFRKGPGLESLNIDHSAYDQVFLWMPTYRKAMYAHVETDGSEASFGLHEILGEQRKRVNEILKQKRILLLIKPHPMDTILKEELTGAEQIRVITNEDLTHAGLELYGLISEADVLLSDYSSTVVDYLLLDRPIALVCGDLEEYRTSRGFVFDPVDDYLPGPMLKTADEFLDYLEHNRGIDETYRDKRQRLRALFHSHTDGQSAQRVCDMFFGPEEKRV